MLVGSRNMHLICSTPQVVRSLPQVEAGLALNGLMLVAPALLNMRPSTSGVASAVCVTSSGTMLSGTPAAGSSTAHATAHEVQQGTS
jgi:hypothetical protein